MTKRTLLVLALAVMLVSLATMVSATPTVNGLYYNGTYQNGSIGDIPLDWEQVGGDRFVEQRTSGINRSLNFSSAGQWRLSDDLPFPESTNGNWSIHFNIFQSGLATHQFKPKQDDATNNHMRFRALSNGNFVWNPSFANQAGEIVVCTGCIIADVNQTIEFRRFTNSSLQYTVCIDDTCYENFSASIASPNNEENMQLETGSTLHINNFHIRNLSFVAPIPPPPPGPTRPNITLVFPINNDVNNSWNGSVIFTTNITANMTSNDTRWELIPEHSNGTYHQFNFTSAIVPDDNYNINFTADNSGITESFIFNYTLDTTLPIQNIITPANLGIINGPIIWQSSHNDTNLFSIELNVSCTTGNFTNRTENILEQNFLYNQTIDDASLNGSCTATLQTCDGHTSFAISDYEFEKNAFFTSIKYSFGDENYEIRPKDYLLYSFHDTYKNFDRYNFRFTKLFKTTKETFVVKSTKRIVVVGKKNFDGHLVIPDLNKWIDFEEKGKKDIRYSIERRSDFEVWVTLEGDLGRNFEFSSTGDLNCVTTAIFLDKPITNITFISAVPENSITPITLRITVNESIINTSNPTASLFYNSTEFVASPTLISPSLIEFQINITTAFVSVDNISVPFFWNYSLSAPGGNVNFTSDNFTQDVFLLQLSNCSITSDVQTINFTFFDEVTLEKLSNNSLDITFELHLKNGSSTSNFRNYSFDLDGADSYAICLKPTTATFLADIIILYGRDNYKTRPYFFVNKTLNSNTSFVNLFQINDSLPTLATITVNDLEDNKVTSADISVNRFYPGENVFRTVQISRTDSSGVAGAWIIPDSVFYQFIITRNGQVVFMSVAEEIITTTDVFLTANIGESDFLRSFKVSENLASSITFNNATGNFTFIWNDNSNTVSGGTLTAFQITAFGKTQLCSATASGSSNTVVCNTNVNTTNILMEAQGVLSTPSRHSPISTFTLIVNNLSTFSIWGLQGVFLAILLIFVFATLGSFKPAASAFFSIITLIFCVVAGLWQVGTGVLIGLIIGMFIHMFMSRG